MTTIQIFKDSYVSYKSSSQTKHFHHEAISCVAVCPTLTIVVIHYGFNMDRSAGLFLTLLFPVFLWRCSVKCPSARVGQNTSAVSFPDLGVRILASISCVISSVSSTHNSQSLHNSTPPFSQAETLIPENAAALMREKQWKAKVSGF